MPQEIYFIPQTPTAFFNFQSTAMELCTAHTADWDLPADTMSGISAIQATYISAYNITSNPKLRSPAATEARKAAQTNLSTALTDLFNHYLLHNDAISADDKAALHIHSTANGGTKSAPAPTTTPVVQLISEGISQLFVVYADSSTPNKHHKPHGVAFAEIWYKVGDTIPAIPAECTERFSATRSHEPLVFAPEQRGQICYVFARWVNKNGKTGPWSNLYSAMIP